MMQFAITPWAGSPGAVVDIMAPSGATVDLSAATQVYLSPLSAPIGLPTFSGGGTTAFGYPQPFSVVDSHHVRFTLTALAQDPLQGPVSGDYLVIIVSFIDSVNAGQFRVLKPGQMASVPPPAGADFVNWWPIGSPAATVAITRRPVGRSGTTRRITRGRTLRFGGTQ
jgi:hypothetical protein